MEDRGLKINRKKTVYLKPAIGRRLRSCVITATGIRKHTQVELLWITLR